MKEKDFNKPLLKIFLSYFKNHKGLFILDMSCAMLVSIIDIAFPIASRYCMNELLPNHVYKTFFIITGSLILFFILRSVLLYIITYYGHIFGIHVEADIREDLYNHFQELDFDFYDQNRTGVLMSRLTSDLFEVTELAHHGPEDLLISVLTIVGSLIVMFTIEPKLATVVLIIVPVFSFIVILLRKRLITTWMNVKKRTGQINADIESMISGMKTSKAFDNAKIGFERFEKTNNLFKRSKNESYKAMAIFNSLVEFTVCFLQIAVLAAGGYLIMGDNLNYVDLITFMLYITAFITPIKKLATFTEVFMSGTAGLKRFIEIMRTEPTIKEKENPKVLNNAKGNIEFKNVSFGYKKDVEVLHNVSFKVNPGETVALVGHTGSGKSTISQLIPRFYDVNSGKITLDKNDVRDLTKSSIRKNIGIVQQDVFLFADTVLENIKYGRPDATFDEIVEASKKAEIYDDIMAMPDGFNTYVGERGTLLSGGQKQRVAIARIFLKNPPILILDEATSALDTITEALIQDSFKKLSDGRTTVIIAHRLATIKDADRIIVIDSGNILEEGTHAELMKKKGMYYKLYNTQKLLA